MSTKIITGEVRGSYVNVFRPRKNELNGKEEYSLVVLIPKTDKKTLKKIRDAEKAAIEKTFNGKTPKGLRRVLRDGDTDDTYAGRDGYTGCYFARVKSDRRPGIVDKSMNDVISDADFQSGDYCRVSLNAYAYNKTGNQGVSLGLENIQVLRKGEPLGNTSRPEDDFGALDDDEFEEEEDLEFG